MRNFTVIAALSALILPFTALAAKESLGVFSNWAAFHDAETPRCYAIAKPQDSRTQRDYVPYASIATWPQSRVRNQLHIRLSREMAQGAQVRLSVGNRSFQLAGSGADAWAQDSSMDAAIVAAMRSASSMSVSARSRGGTRFTDRYDLAGVATAMDAAVVACSAS